MISNEFWIKIAKVCADIALIFLLYHLNLILTTTWEVKIIPLKSWRTGGLEWLMELVCSIMAGTIFIFFQYSVTLVLVVNLFREGWQLPNWARKIYQVLRQSTPRCSNSLMEYQNKLFTLKSNEDQIWWVSKQLSTKVWLYMVL